MIPSLSGHAVLRTPRGEEIVEGSQYRCECGFVGTRHEYIGHAEQEFIYREEVKKKQARRRSLRRMSQIAKEAGDY